MSCDPTPTQLLAGISLIAIPSYWVGHCVGEITQREKLFELLKLHYLAKYTPQELPHKNSWQLICKVFKMPVNTRTN